MKSFAEKLLAVLGSLKLTVVCFALAIVLVFIGTLAQVRWGVHHVQPVLFRNFILLLSPTHQPAIKIPVFPGGYLIGSVLLLNLIVAHIPLAKPSRISSAYSLHMAVWPFY